MFWTSFISFCLFPVILRKDTGAQDFLGFFIQPRLASGTTAGTIENFPTSPITTKNPCSQVSAVSSISSKVYFCVWHLVQPLVSCLKQVWYYP